MSVRSACFDTAIDLLPVPCHPPPYVAAAQDDVTGALSALHSSLMAEVASTRAALSTQQSAAIAQQSSELTRAKADLSTQVRSCAGDSCLNSSELEIMQISLVNFRYKYAYKLVKQLDTLDV